MVRRGDSIGRDLTDDSRPEDLTRTGQKVQYIHVWKRCCETRGTSSIYYCAYRHVVIPLNTQTLRYRYPSPPTALRAFPIIIHPGSTSDSGDVLTNSRLDWAGLAQCNQPLEHYPLHCSLTNIANCTHQLHQLLLLLHPDDPLTLYTHLLPTSYRPRKGPYPFRTSTP
jgi:hypothetical protein